MALQATRAGGSLLERDDGLSSLPPLPADATVEMMAARARLLLTPYERHFEERHRLAASLAVSQHSFVPPQTRAAVYVQQQQQGVLPPPHVHVPEKIAKPSGGPSVLETSHSPAVAADEMPSALEACKAAPPGASCESADAQVPHTAALQPTRIEQSIDAASNQEDALSHATSQALNRAEEPLRPLHALPRPTPPSFVSTLPADTSDAIVLAARLADAERHIAALQIELATANERAESFRALAAAKDEIIMSARNQTKEWRKHASEVLIHSNKGTSAAPSNVKENVKEKKKK